MKLFSVDEVAKLVGVKPKTVRTWIASRMLAHYKISGRCVRVSEDQLHAFLRAREVKKEVH